jgi:hypothetical protein
VILTSFDDFILGFYLTQKIQIDSKMLKCDLKLIIGPSWALLNIRNKLIAVVTQNYKHEIILLLSDTSDTFRYLMTIS